MATFGRLVRVEGTERLREIAEPAIFALNHSNAFESVLAPATLMALRDGLKRHGRFVDIGRFMIVPAYRRNIRVVMRLMRAAIIEVVGRGYTHFLTDVFEEDPHSPLHFHTRVLGFERIGTHRYGELACTSSRILLILDIARAYHRLKAQDNKIWKELGEGVWDVMEGPRLVAPAP